MAAITKVGSSFNRNAAVNRIINALHAKSFRTLIGRMARGVAGLRNLAPYAAIELLLPGGSLIALLLWFYRRHASETSEGQLDVTVALTTTPCSSA